MTVPEGPLVSVLTPVYNGADFLAQCIESVLSQTYTNYEYIIVNNCSTDGTLDIATRYAQKDRRIRVVTNEKFVGVIDNHNIAFSLISKDARYCKVVSADDFLFPDCILRMVECAEANPSVGIVGSYQLSGASVRWQGFTYPKVVLSGAEMCRQILLGGDKTFGFGSPTSTMYRADLIRDSGGRFYPDASPHADTSACFHCMEKSDFGFVYQVLSYEKLHEATQTSKSKQMNRYSSAYLNDLIRYGASFLTKEELEVKVAQCLADYYRFLAMKYVSGFKDKEFWDYHQKRLTELGYPLRRSTLIKAAVVKVLREVLNPEQAIRKVLQRGSRKPGNARAGAGPTGLPGNKQVNAVVKN